MIHVKEALELVLEHARSTAPREVAVADALGSILAENVVSDIDSPPHDKSLMDGYAVLAADLAGGPVELKILEEVTAGQVPTRCVSHGHATRVMTGAPIPEDADAVVMVEQTECTRATGGSLGNVRIEEVQMTPGTNIMRQGTSVRRGEVVLTSGSEIRAIEVGLLSEVGRTRVCVFARPTVAVLPTGNELVPSSRTPQAGQIRNTNGPMLLAATMRAGGEAIDLGIGRDDRGQLDELIGRGLQADILVLSGGVSAGVMDLVPEVLKALGVEQIFHKIHFKPGKPIWFGVRRGEPRDTLVFGLPGNPVSSMVCFELFVRPTILRMLGRESVEPRSTKVKLSSDYEHREDRPTYRPALVQEAEGSKIVEPVFWHGSADLRNLAKANALAYFPAGERTYAAGEEVQVYCL